MDKLYSFNTLRIGQRIIFSVQFVQSVQFAICFQRGVCYQNGSDWQDFLLKLAPPPHPHRMWSLFLISGNSLPISVVMNRISPSLQEKKPSRNTAYYWSNCEMHYVFNVVGGLDPPTPTHTQRYIVFYCSFCTGCASVETPTIIIGSYTLVAFFLPLIQTSFTIIDDNLTLA